MVTIAFLLFLAGSLWVGKKLCPELREANARVSRDVEALKAYRDLEISYRMPSYQGEDR